jgi:hypothetical protein
MRVQLIAQPRRRLELERLAGLLHALLQPLHELAVAPEQEQPHVGDLIRICVAIDVVHARPGAAIDLVLQARSRAVAEHEVRARAQLEVPIDDAQRLPSRSRRVIRAEVPRAVVTHVAHELEPGPRRLGIELEHEIVGVVAQLHVEARAVLLDEVVLEQQRFLHVAHDDRLDVADELREQRHEHARVGAVEVLAHAVLQDRGLADVDHLAMAIAHDVHAGLAGQSLEHVGELVVVVDARRPALGHRALARAATRRGARRLRRALGRRRSFLPASHSWRC